MGEEIDYNQIFGLDEGSGDGGTTPPPENTGDGQGTADKHQDTSGNAGGAGNQPGAGSQPGKETGTGTDAGGEKGSASVLVGDPGHRGARGVPSAGNADRNGADMESVLKGLGITDPYTGKPITTKAEYDAYRDRVYQERRSFILERTGMSEAEVDEFISTVPQVRKANEDGAKARELMERERQRYALERVDAEVRKISTMDPSVKSIADLTAGENYPKMLELVKRGYELSDAWKLANFDKLQGAAQAASRQAAINSGAGRAGFQVTRGQGAGNDTVSVPGDVLEMYREINPDATDEEIRADYNKYLRNSKK